jgi:cytochrome c-type biogenesis protein CcmH
MRTVIRTRLMAGESDQQILDEFVASYGDSILTEPPKRGVSLGVWLGPPLAVLVGAGAVVALLRAWRRTPRSVSSPPPAGTLETDVLDEFSRFRQEIGT